MGGSSTQVSQTKYDGIIVQSSLMGVSIPRGWGTNKLGCNLIDYLDFSATKVNNNGGKGGSASTTQYDYKATLVMAICLGGNDSTGVAGIRTIWKDSAIFTATPSGSKEVNGTTVTISAKTPLQAAGLSLFKAGAINQTPWTYLQSAHPTHALGYSGITYVAAENYDLDSSASTPNHVFEVQFAIRASISGSQIDDALGSDIIPDILSDIPRYPAGAAGIGDLSVFRTYIIAQGLWISPIATDGRQADDLLTEILKASNSECFWDNGLQITPYGDTAITANGATYTPNVAPIYNLTWDDILPNSGGEDPIQWDIARTEEAYNYVQVGFTDRSQQYSDNVATAIDQANYLQYGKVQGSVTSIPSVCDATVANTIAQLMVQRSANVRRTCEFKLPATFGLLNPMDIVTVPLRNGGTRLIQFIECNESGDDEIDIKAEELLVGVGQAALYTRQEALGIPNDFNVDPGDAAAPMIVNPPVTLTNGQLEVWIASAGGPDWGGAYIWTSLDGDTYQLSGQISEPSRYGVTTSDLAVSADPDTTATLGVNMSISNGYLNSATDAEADAGATLCIVGTEVIGFSAATLTTLANYNLTGYIRRGQAGTTIADQPSGSAFLRLDGAYGVVEYNAATLGKTIYVKLQSYNIYGGAVEDLDLCEAYEFVAQQNGALVTEVAWTEVTGIPANLDSLTGTEQILNIHVPVGGNNVINSDWSNDDSGWAYYDITNYGGSVSYAGGRNFSAPGPTYYYGARNVLWGEIGSPSAIPANYYYFGPCQKGFNLTSLSDIQRYGLAVTLGDTIFWGGLIAGHGANSAFYRIRILNASGSILGEYDAPASGFVNARTGGLSGIGGDPSAFYQCAGSLTIPSYSTPAAWALIGTYVETYGGDTTAYIFTTEPYLVKGSPGQTVAPPYTPGPPDRYATYGATTGVNLTSTTYGTLADVSVYTPIGVAAGISGQGTGATTNVGAVATQNNLAYGSSYLTGFGGLAPLSYVSTGAAGQVYSGTYGYLTDTGIYTPIGTAAGIAGQAYAATDTTIQPGATVNETFYQSTDPASSLTIPNGAFWAIPGGPVYMRLGGAWQYIAAPSVRDGDTLFSQNTPGSGSYTIPATSIGYVTVVCQGGGGGSGDVYGTDNSGGGGGTATKHFAVSPGDVISFTVGALGTSSNTGTGGSGTASSATCSAHGVSLTGNGGSGGTPVHTGAGGTASGGDTNVTGTAGGAGFGLIQIIAHSS